MYKSSWKLTRICIVEIFPMNGKVTSMIKEYPEVIFIDSLRLKIDKFAEYFTLVE